MMNMDLNGHQGTIHPFWSSILVFTILLYSISYRYVALIEMYKINFYGLKTILVEAFLLTLTTHSTQRTRVVC